MRNKAIITAVGAAALAALTPVAASATTTDINAVDTTYEEPREEEDGFPWGLLGLLGLLGLIPRKKAPDVHIDNRHGGGTGTGTGTGTRP